jgi:UDP-glucose 4-epimerase
MKHTVLLTGGTGFIGSHTAVELIQAGYRVVLADNLSNSSADVAQRIGRITGETPAFYAIDCSDKAALEQVFSDHRIDAVIHFAGLKAVGESVEQPLRYYRNNLDSALTLLEVMQEREVRRIIFSSSATVYGAENPIPYTEAMSTGACSNPYGWTKHMIEQILRDAAGADSRLSVVLLRYFNPIGAHESGLMGERPQGIPNNLMPYITQVAAGIRERLYVFGNDYPTRDGTGVRDYIHVVDLAKGHVAALRYTLAHTGTEVFNLGTGTGCSVLEIVHAFEKATGVAVPYTFAPRRAGDIPAFYADPRKAREALGWKAEKSLEDMCRDSWRWQQSRDAALRETE